MKGISPLIAIVLIVAFVVAIGSIVNVWLSGLATEQTEAIEGDSESFINCASNTWTVSEVRYDSAGANGLVNVTAVSAGSVAMNNVTVTVVGSGGATSSQVFYNGTGESLPAGGVIAASVDLASAGISLPPQLVTVRGLCEGRAVTGTCEEGQSCIKAV